MGDLFGPWVDEWIINEVIQKCMSQETRNYLFLTKNPRRYDTLPKRPSNFYYGTTIDSQARANDVSTTKVANLNFLCIEPILTEIDLPGLLDAAPGIEWVILGTENGNRKEKVIPDAQWIESISTTCFERGIPLFVKRGYVKDGEQAYLRSIMGNAFRQEYPERMAGYKRC